MGSPPPPDLPTPPEPGTSDLTLGTSFGVPPIGLGICGFALPGFSIPFEINIKLPTLPKFDFPPTLNFLVALNCDLSNPISASVEFGGGRVPQMDPDPFETTP